MRTALAILSLSLAGAALDTASAEILYPYCARYAGKSSGTNCGFSTLQQCQWAISGNGGFCESNPRYFAPAPPPAGRYRR